MLYNYIFVDIANLFYRLKKSSNNSVDVTKKMINYIEDECKAHLRKNGELYILFDPISYSDLGESRNFHVSLNERKKLLSDYKANRDYSPLYQESIETFRKFYLYRGNKLKLVYSDDHEADDYVEPLLERCVVSDGTLTIALVTSDLDWARYIYLTPTKKIHLINEGFDNPYTVKQFQDIFEFKPTIAANTVYKALFGDKSDNIQGAVFMKKAKFATNIKKLCRDYIQVVSKENYKLDDVVQQFKKAKFMEINNKPERDAFDLLFLALYIVDMKVPVLEKFYTNIRVIRSSLTDHNIEPFIHCNPIKEKTNEIIYQSLFGIKFSSQFGKV